MTRGLKSPPVEVVRRFRSLFEQLESDRGAGEPRWLRSLRSKAMDRFEALGLPSTKDEDWRYTNLTPVAKRRFELPGEAAGASSPALDPGPADGPRWVFRDGRLSSAPTVPSGVQVGHLPRDAGGPEDVRIGRLADADGHALVALNTALFDEGILLSVGEESRLSGPLSIVFTTGASTRPVLCNPRLGIALGRSSRAVLVELFLGTGPSWTNAVVEVTCVRRSSSRAVTSSIDCGRVTAARGRWTEAGWAATDELSWSYGFQDDDKTENPTS